MNVIDAIVALHELIESCREGSFYADYDDSWAMIGRADDALAALTPLLLPRGL